MPASRPLEAAQRSGQRRATSRRARRSARPPTPATCSSSAAGSRRAAGASTPTERGAAWLDRPIVDVRRPSARQAPAQGARSAAASSRSSSAEERHRLRIALKKLRYADRVLRGALSEEAHASLSRGAEGAAGRARPSERRRRRRETGRRPGRRAQRRARMRDRLPGRRPGARLARARASSSSSRQPMGAWQEFAARQAILALTRWQRTIADDLDPGRQHQGRVRQDHHRDPSGGGVRRAVAVARRSPMPTVSARAWSGPACAPARRRRSPPLDWVDELAPPPRGTERLVIDARRRDEEEARLRAGQAWPM